MIAATDGHAASPPNVDLVRLLDIVKAEYLEMPGLRLTGRQAQRLWALDTATCDALLGTLERAHFLRRSPGGDYMLALRD
jgi:DNA-binding IclR family transcriptional regulator